MLRRGVFLVFKKGLFWAYLEILRLRLKPKPIT